MHRFGKFFLFSFFYIFLALLTCSFICLAMLQTKLGQQWVKKEISSFAHSLGIEISIQNLKGHLPFSWDFSGIEIKIKETAEKPGSSTIFIEDLSFRIAILPLLEKRLHFSYFYASSIETSSISPADLTRFDWKALLEKNVSDQIETSPVVVSSVTTSSFVAKQLQQMESKLTSFPWSIEIPQGSIDTKKPCYLLTDCPKQSMRIKFGLFLKKYLEEVRTEVKATLLTNSFHLLCEGKRKEGVHLHLSGYLDSSEEIHSYLLLPSIEGLAFESSLEGQASDFRLIFLSREPKELLTHPLRARIDLLWQSLGEVTPSPLQAPARLQCSFQWFGEKALNITQFSIENSWMNVTGNWSTNRKGHLLRGTGEAHVYKLQNWDPWISPCSFEGNAYLKGSFDGTREFLDFKIDRFSWEKVSYQEMCGVLKGEAVGNLWKGDIAFSALHSSIPLSITANLELEGREGALLDLKIENLEISGPSTEVHGHVTTFFSPFLVEGEVHGSIDVLNRFQDLFPNWDLSGSCKGDMRFSFDRLNESTGGKPQQWTDIHLTLTDFSWQKSYLKEGSISTHLKGLFQNVKSLDGWFELRGSDLKVEGGEIRSFSSFTRVTHQVWSFDLLAQGNWYGQNYEQNYGQTYTQQPFLIQSKGAWKTNEKEHCLTLTELKGTLPLSTPCQENDPYNFFLQQPCTFCYGADHLSLENLKLKIGKGLFMTDFYASDEFSKGRVSAAHIPLTLLSLIAPSVSCSGTTSFEGKISSIKENTKKNSSGFLQLTLEEASFMQPGRDGPLDTKGTCTLHLDQNHLQIHTFLRAPAKSRSISEQFLEGIATLPVEVSLYPLSFHLIDKAAWQANLTLEGKLEELFDFLDLKFQRITGIVASKLLLSGSLEEPHLVGSLSLEEGSYENFFLGIFFKDIDIKGYADKDKVLFTQIQGLDALGGEVAATGLVSFNQIENFPFSFDLNLKKARAIQVDTFWIDATGKLILSGTKERMFLQGRTDVIKSEYLLSESVPFDYPNLPITFVHVPHSAPLSGHLSGHLSGPFPAPFLHQKQQDLPPFPFQYDLELHAEDTLFLRGKGLSSVWKGDVRLTGVNTSLQATGNLELVRGEFQFAGKTFILNQGEIHFSEDPHHPAYLNVLGSLKMKGLNLIAQLKGPLTSPTLSFSSLPPLSTSEIVSYILFNKPQAEIKPIEAVSLAQTILSLSGGGGPDMLEAIRKKLGIDRLTIVSGKNRSDQVSVQIGRYLTKGVLVTLSQSATKSDFIVEVDLEHGFTFEAESQDLEEGKFSLKWNCNY